MRMSSLKMSLIVRHIKELSIYIHMRACAQRKGDDGSSDTQLTALAALIISVNQLYSLLLILFRIRLTYEYQTNQSYYQIVD